MKAKQDPNLKSLLDRLLLDVEVFSAKLENHISGCEIRYHGSLSNQYVAVIAPYQSWLRDDPHDQILEMELSKLFHKWWEPFALLFAGAGKSLAQTIEKLGKSWQAWIHRTHYWDIPNDISEAKRNLNSTVRSTIKLLLELRQEKSDTILIADTNALLACPDISRYGTNIEMASYSVLIPSTVLGELDELKVFGRNPNVQKSANRAIRRIKGFRTQGDLTEGVVVNKTVMVKVIANEPDFTRTLQSLDPTNNDDRIIARSLQVQIENPSATIIIVTGDINLQTKAHAARIPFIEPPEDNSEIESEKS